jgi:SecD/SecF fusion protein
MPDRHDPLELLRELRDVGLTLPGPDEFHSRVSAAVEAEIERERRPPRASLNGSSPGGSTCERFDVARRRPAYARLAGGLAPVIGVLVVAVVVAVFLGLDRSAPSSTAPSHGSVEFVYQGLPSAQAPVVTRGALERTVELIKVRLRALGFGAARVSLFGANLITIVLPELGDTARAEQVIGTTAQLTVYDWEANVLTPNGKTVASQLQTQDPAALEISQGSGNAAPGQPGAGSMNLYDAVTLASKQPYSASARNTRIGDQYWLFGAPGSAACAAAARDQRTAPASGQHCLLSGPDNNQADLLSALPAGVSASDGQVVIVPRGTVVLQAIPANFSKPVPIGDPGTQFFVLKDNVALRGTEITHPKQSTDPNTGAPDVTFSFTRKGKTEFQDVTAAIARRGELISGLGQTLNQHFAVALDNELITVPYISFKQYPDGVNGEQGADLTSGFTVTTARSLAAELRLGALPINLKLICRAPASTSSAARSASLPCASPRAH